MAASRTDRIAGVRTYTRWSLVLVALTALLAPAVDLSQRGLPWAVVVPALAALLFVCAEATRLLLVGTDGMEPRAWAPPRTIAAAVLAIVLFAAIGCTSEQLQPSWALPFAVLVTGVSLGAERRTRWLLLAGATVVTGVVGALAALAGWTTEAPLALIAASMFVVAFVGGLTVTQVWIWDVTLQVDNARRVEAEVAVLRERLRFAADLHDVQGHQLQTIALKAELARRLVGSDDDGARRHAAEVQQLALEALAETRAIAHGYREVRLEKELSNAVAILRAAGVEASIEGEPAPVPAELEPLFGSLVREGTTNLLRHSHAERCQIAIVREAGELVVRMDDDGVAAALGTAGRAGRGAGLDGLRERFAAAGGRLD
ncbi:histidine kinase, partial [Conexibacter sp. JD483]|uniref:sensor histidine kinase n=2 Tax=Conexibacter TaxID=191494 RepID=UPI00287049CF